MPAQPPRRWSRRVRTPLGTISLHRLPAELFIGYEIEPDGSKIATAEKALFDTLYLAPARSRLFARLPELEIPRQFRWRAARARRAPASKTVTTTTRVTPRSPAEFTCEPT
jgi:hypothetical protein